MAERLAYLSTALDAFSNSLRLLQYKLNDHPELSRYEEDLKRHCSRIGAKITASKSKKWIETTTNESTRGLRSEEVSHILLSMYLTKQYDHNIVSNALDFVIASAVNASDAATASLNQEFVDYVEAANILRLLHEVEGSEGVDGGDGPSLDGCKEIFTSLGADQRERCPFFVNLYEKCFLLGSKDVESHLRNLLLRLVTVHRTNVTIIFRRLPSDLILLIIRCLYVIARSPDERTFILRASQNAFHQNPLSFSERLLFFIYQARVENERMCDPHVAVILAKHFAKSHVDDEVSFYVKTLGKYGKPKEGLRAALNAVHNHPGSFQFRVILGEVCDVELRRRRGASLHSDADTADAPAADDDDVSISRLKDTQTDVSAVFAWL